MTEDAGSVAPDKDCYTIPNGDCVAPVCSLHGINWQAVAAVLADELKRWGWGDFHYGLDGKQEEAVVNALAVYYKAMRLIDGEADA